MSLAVSTQLGSEESFTKAICCVLLQICSGHYVSIDSSSKKKAPIQTHSFSNLAKFLLTPPIFLSRCLLCCPLTMGFSERGDADSLLKGQREHGELGPTAFQTRQSHSGALTKSWSGDSQLRRRQKEGWAELKRLLTEGEMFSAAKSSHYLTLFCFNYNWLEKKFIYLRIVFICDYI